LKRQKALCEVVKRAELTLGGSDPRTLTVLKSLAGIRAKRGRTAEALETFVTLLDRQRRAFPSGHPAIQKTLEAIAKLENESD